MYCRREGASSFRILAIVEGHDPAQERIVACSPFRKGQGQERRYLCARPPAALPVAPGPYSSRPRSAGLGS